jgi:hypothetical protein
MRKSVFMMLVALFAANGFCVAQDVSEGVAAPASEQAEIGDFVDSAADALAAEDPQFAAFVEWSILEAALVGRDAGRVTDVALALAEAERILVRQHASGMTSDELLKKAANLAAMNKDSATMERLKSAAGKLGKPELTAAIDAASKLSAPARAVPAGLDLEKLTATETALKDKVDAAISDAMLTNDPSFLASLQTEVTEAKDISEGLKGYLTQAIKATLASIVADSSATNDALQQLLAPSRGTQDVRNKKLPTGGLTYGQVAEQFFASTVFPNGIEGTFYGVTVGLTRDNVICETCEWNGGTGLWVTCRARYSGKVNLGPLGKKSVGAERVRVYYQNGNIKVDLGGMKGVINTRSISDWVTKQVNYLKASSAPAPPQTISYVLKNKTSFPLKLQFTPSGNAGSLGPGKSTTCKSPVKGGDYPKVKATVDKPNGASWLRTISKNGQTYEVIKTASGIQIVP